MKVRISAINALYLNRMYDIMEIMPHSCHGGNTNTYITFENQVIEEAEHLVGDEWPKNFGRMVLKDKSILERLLFREI